MPDRRDLPLAVLILCLTVGCRPAAASPLSYTALMDGSEAASPVDHRFLALPEDAAPPKHLFEGRLELLDEATGGSVNRLTGGAELGAEAEHLPEFDFEFVQMEDNLIPVRRGLIITSHPIWNILLEPGRVWQDPDDRGMARASFPFTLVPKNGNSSFHGVMSFLFDGARISRVWYQIAQETSVSLHWDWWGLLDAAYHPQPVGGAEQIRKNFARELDSRLPTRSIDQLAKDYPGVNIAVFNRHVPPEHMTTYGVVTDRVHYRGGCNTRYGEYPYCEWIRMPSFSTAKSAFVSLALMRLAQKQGPQVTGLLVKDYVPEASSSATAASGGDWSAVTFDNILDMATGNFTTSSFMIDEEGRIFAEFFAVESYAEKIRIAFDWPYHARPGTRWVYRSSDTFIAVQALQNYLRTVDDPGADLFDFVVKEIYQPVGLGPGVFTTLRTSEDNWQGQPIGATGLWWIPDDVAKLAVFLNNKGGQIHGEQILHPGLLAGALQGNPHDRGVDRPGGKYNDAFWADHFTVSEGFGCAFYAPYMAGYSGNIVALLPNGVTYYYFSDHRDFNWHAVVREVNKILPMCQN